MQHVFFIFISKGSIVALFTLHVFIENCFTNPNSHKMSTCVNNDPFLSKPVWLLLSTVNDDIQFLGELFF